IEAADHSLRECLVRDPAGRQTDAKRKEREEISFTHAHVETNVGPRRSNSYCTIVAAKMRSPISKPSAVFRPSTIAPIHVYRPSRWGAAACMKKNCEPPLSRPASAIPTAPATYSPPGSAGVVKPGPPSPVAVG